MSGPAPGPHDGECEAEWIDLAYAYSGCGCAERSELRREHHRSAPYTEAECGTACDCPQHVAVCARREWIKAVTA